MEEADKKMAASSGTNTSDTDSLECKINEFTAVFVEVIYVLTVLVLLIFFLAALATWILKSFKVPRSVVFFFLGMVLRALVLLNDSWGKSVIRALQLCLDNPILIESFFFSILIFSWAFTMDCEIFMRIIKECLVLSFFDFAISALLMLLVGLYSFPKYQLPVFSAIFYAIALQPPEFLCSDSAIHCADDRSKRIVTLLQGEALINDSLCYVLCLSLSSFRGSSGNLIVQTLIVVLRCIWGVVLGFCFGQFATICIAWVHGQTINELIIPFSLALSTFIITENMQASSSFAVITAAVTVSLRQRTFSSGYRKAIESFGNAFYLFADGMVSVGTGAIATHALIYSGIVASVTIHDYLGVVLTYSFLVVSRLLTVLFANLVFQWMSCELTWKEVIAVTWNRVLGIEAIVLITIGIYSSRSLDISLHIVLFHISGVICIEFLVNMLTINSILEMIDFAEISPVRRASMANAVYHLKQVITKSTNVQKMNRHTPIANWQWVSKHTQIEDPYSSNKIKLDRTPYFQARYHTCSECNSKQLLQLSEEEQVEMIKDMNQRAVKAVQDIYWQQFYNGLIDQKTVDILMSVARAALRDQKYLKVEDVKESMEVSKFYLFVRKYINKCLASIEDFLGTKKLKDEAKGRGSKKSSSHDADTISTVEEKLSLLQKIIYHPVFEYVIHTYIIASLIFRIVGLLFIHFKKEIVNDPSEKEAILKTYIQEYMAQIVILFLLSVLRFLALGFARFFRSSLNIVCLLLLVVQTICFTLFLLKVFDDNHYILFMSGITSFVLLLRLVIIIRIVLRLLKQIIEKAIDTSLHRSFDIAHCFLTGEEGIRKQVDYMVEYEPIAFILKAQMRRNLSNIRREIVVMQQRYPNIVIAAKTKLATHGVLNDAKRCIMELKEEGVIEDTEFRKLQEIIQHRLTNVSRVLSTTVFSINPSDILGMIEWIVGEEKVKYFLNLEGTSEEVYRPHTYIHSVGSVPLGVHIIVYGIVKVTGKLGGRVSDCLPNSDSTLCFKRDVYFEEYLSNCQTLGLVGALNNENFMADSICETEVRTFFIPSYKMKEALQLFSRPPSLEYQIWRFLSLKIALPILSEQPHWTDASSEKLKLQLEKALLPDLLKERSLVVHQAVRDIVLIQGRVLSYVDQEEYVGPVYISRTNEHLGFPGSLDSRARPVLLLLAEEGYELPAGLNWSGQCSNVQKPTYCALHSTQGSSTRHTSIHSVFSRSVSMETRERKPVSGKR